MGKMDISYILDPRHEKLFTIVSMLQLGFYKNFEPYTRLFGDVF